jgi:hypothetical protein
VSLRVEPAVLARARDEVPAELVEVGAGVAIAFELSQRAQKIFGLYRA